MINRGESSHWKLFRKRTSVYLPHAVRHDSSCQTSTVYVHMYAAVLFGALLRCQIISWTVGNLSCSREVRMYICIGLRVEYRVVRFSESQTSVNAISMIQTMDHRESHILQSTQQRSRKNVHASFPNSTCLTAFPFRYVWPSINVVHPDDHIGIMQSRTEWNELCEKRIDSMKMKSRKWRESIK